MNCDQARENASDYIDGELDAEVAALLEEHLTACNNCPPLMAALIGVLAELRDLPIVSPDASWMRATVARTITERNTP